MHADGASWTLVTARWYMQTWCNAAMPWSATGIYWTMVSAHSAVLVFLKQVSCKADSDSTVYCQAPKALSHGKGLKRGCCSGTDDLSSEDMEHPTQASQVELARLMFWLMVVGYNLRTLEVRFDMEQTMLLPPGV